jgi:hypothetical protein
MNMFCLIIRRHVLKKQKFACKIRVFITEWANKYLVTFTRYKFCAVCTLYGILRQFEAIYSDLSNWWSVKEKYKDVECKEALQWEAKRLCNSECG